jgi:hypothetical protein
MSLIALLVNGKKLIGTRRSEAASRAEGAPASYHLRFAIYELPLIGFDRSAFVGGRHKGGSIKKFGIE